MRNRKKEASSGWSGGWLAGVEEGGLVLFGRLRWQVRLADHWHVVPVSGVKAAVITEGAIDKRGSSSSLVERWRSVEWTRAVLTTYSVIMSRPGVEG